MLAHANGDPTSLNTLYYTNEVMEEIFKIKGLWDLLLSMFSSKFEQEGVHARKDPNHLFAF